MFFSDDELFLYDEGLLNWSGVKQARVHNTVYEANCSIGFGTRLGKFFLASELDFEGSDSVDVAPFFKKSVAFGTLKFVMFETDPMFNAVCVLKGSRGVPSGFLRSNIFPR